MPKYIAKQSLGHFRPGDEITGLDEKHIQALLVSGAIAEPVQVVTSDDSNQELDALKVENTDLKAKVTELEKSLAASEKKLAVEIKKTAVPEK